MDRVILTTYLTGRPDPQSGRAIRPDSDECVAQWLPGMNRLRLHGVIFHDHLSERFIGKHESQNVRFVRVPSPADLSNNDYRFFVYREWLAGKGLESVFCTDLFDVRVNRNPHAMIDDEFHLWVGIERDWRIDAATADGRWMLDKLRRCYGEVPAEVAGQPILTAGHWGGRYEHVLRTLDLLTAEIRRIDPRPALNCNMAAFNRVLYRDIGRQRLWMLGAPLHSEFRAYDSAADVCFVHK